MLRDRLIRAYDGRVRRRREARELRGRDTGGVGVLPRLRRLGPGWHLRGLPNDPEGVSPGHPGDHVSRRVLVIGPGGSYLLTVVEHGRSRVLVAGDVVQIDGKRPGYVGEARWNARRAGRELGAAVGAAVTVTPVLVFAGTGPLLVHGLPKECLVASHREIDRMLTAGGAVITPATAAKLDAVAATVVDRIDHPPWPGRHDGS